MTLADSINLRRLAQQYAQGAEATAPELPEQTRQSLDRVADRVADFMNTGLRSGHTDSLELTLPIGANEKARLLCDWSSAGGSVHVMRGDSRYLQLYDQHHYLKAAILHRLTKPLESHDERRFKFVSYNATGVLGYVLEPAATETAQPPRNLLVPDGPAEPKQAVDHALLALLTSDFHDKVEQVFSHWQLLAREMGQSGDHAVSHSTIRPGWGELTTDAVKIDAGIQFLAELTWTREEILRDFRAGGARLPELTAAVREMLPTLPGLAVHCYRDGASSVLVQLDLRAPLPVASRNLGQNGEEP